MRLEPRLYFGLSVASPFKVALILFFSITVYYYFLASFKRHHEREDCCIPWIRLVFISQRNSAFTFNVKILTTIEASLSAGFVWFVFLCLSWLLFFFSESKILTCFAFGALAWARTTFELLLSVIWLSF